MFEFLALITNKRYWRLHSLIIRLILRCYGIPVGRGFYTEGTPRLKIRGKASNIRIGNDVSFLGDIDIRNRENGSIIFEDGACVDNDCRFVAANDAVLRVGKRTGIGCYCIFNCGTDVTIGEDCLFSGMIHVQSSQHGTAKGQLIREQRHAYGKIVLGNDVWVAANATILMGAEIGDGCIVGAKALVRAGRYAPNSILAGVPARIVKERA